MHSLTPRISPRSTRPRLTAAFVRALRSAAHQKLLRTDPNLRRAIRMQRGMSLLEILIVLAIITMIGGLTAFALIPRYQKAQVDGALQSSKQVRKAAQLYKEIDSGASDCPSVDDLVKSKNLDAETVKDPWGGDYKISCEDGEIRVTSAGRDKQPGNKDDIRDNMSKKDLEKILE